MKQTLAIVVTFNRLDKLRKCIGLLRTHAANANVLVIDNCSTDGTAEWLSTITDDKVTAIRSESNIGGAGGFNIGVREAVTCGYDYAWLMDDDCMVNADSLSNLHAAADALNGDFGWLSSVALWTDGAPCRMNRQKASPDFYEHAHLLGQSLLLATQATFVSLLVPTAVVRKVGLPIKEFFIWGDDVEYTRRIAVRNGMRSFIVGNSTVTHEMKDNNGSSIAADDGGRIDRYRYAYRNEGYLYRQEGIRGICYFAAKCGLNLWRIATQAKDKRAKRIWVLISSAVRGLFFSPKVEHISCGNK